MISKFYTVYKITHIETGKFYIGRHITSNLGDGYMGSGKYIRHAIEKHGVGAFSKEYLFIFSNENEMYNKEAELVDEAFCLREDTYNIAPGGFDGGFRYINANNLTPRTKGLPISSKRAEAARRNIVKTSTDSREKIANSLRLKYKTEKHPSLGKTFSLETKQRMSDSQKGPSNSQYGLQWITNGIESTRIKKDDLIPEGWKKGRKKRVP